jgi:hypothetical protein
MKLKELIIEILSSGELKNNKGFVTNPSGIGDNVIYGEELEPYTERIKECEEFEGCEELVIIKYPVTLDGNSKSITSRNYKVLEGQKFKGKCYLLSLSLTPEMYDPKKMMEPVKDGAVLTPTIYNPVNFEPKKRIVMEFNPEMLQDQHIYGIGSPSMIEDAEKEVLTNLRKKLHDTLDKILDNPTSYQQETEKSVMVRGMFEVIENTKETETNLLFQIETEKEVACKVWFFETDEENLKKTGKHSLKLSYEVIPTELKDKFTEELGHRSINVTREEINEFLEKNQI